jgi:putative SOS response-associated peptidase YedK
MALVHNQSKSGESRMPVILDQDGSDAWLNPSFGPADLQACLNPVSVSALRYEAVQSPASQAPCSETPTTIQPPELWILRQEIASVLSD